MLFKKIPELSTLSTVTANDEIVIYGVGSSTTGKATLASAIKQGGFVPSTQSSTAGINKIINQHYGARLIHDGSNDWIYHVTVGQEGYDIGVKEGVNLVAEKPDYDLGDWIKNKLSLDQNGLSANLNFGNINITTTEGNVLTSIQGSPSTFRGSVQTPHAAGYKTDVYGNPQHSSTDNTNTWCIKNNAGTAQFQVNYQTGKVINSYLCPTSVNRINIPSGNNFAGYLLWVKIGRIVFFQIADLVCVTATSTHGYALFSGLPTVASGGGGPFTVQRYAAENAAGTHLRLSMGNNGSNQGMIFIHYDSAEANSAHYYGNHWYLAAQ